MKKFELKQITVSIFLGFFLGILCLGSVQVFQNNKYLSIVSGLEDEIIVNDIVLVLEQSKIDYKIIELDNEVNTTYSIEVKNKDRHSANISLAIAFGYI